ncbi:hypothetical protein phiHau3_55 [Streptomyces phage phiHau3]|uniref:Uncharacterized protein n=1 Tax=Streptomyces phage phiHau3 TaxID=1204524 RepID=K4HYN4_9CAUD|nr:hypothetical protein phiHau3_55 [Streptomyces phage phiHau3]AFU62033.1 hypothetical protein phiHau3_55 [Streptomyces phage phiHau3]
MSVQFPQVRAEWREVDWSQEKRTRFTTLLLRLLAEDDEDTEE